MSKNLGCFIGEFKKEKNTAFLIDALHAIKLKVPDFQFIFFGYGAKLDSIKESCEKYSWIKFGGVANEIEKAHLSKAGAIILNPGRVGLIAVDSIAMSCPMVSCKLKDQHAPEIEYLSAPSTILMTEYDVPSYVDAVIQLFNDPESKKAMSQSLKELQPLYTVEAMAKNFHSSVMSRL
jgi:glycosyltransferase involved in cell wall biosynthesis